MNECGDEEVKQVLECPRGALCTSPCIRDEVMSIIADIARKEWIQRVAKAESSTIMADENANFRF